MCRNFNKNHNENHSTNLFHFSFFQHDFLPASIWYISFEQTSLSFSKKLPSFLFVKDADQIREKIANIFSTPTTQSAAERKLDELRQKFSNFHSFNGDGDDGTR